MDLQEAFDKGFDAVKMYVDRSFDAFERRFLELEAHIKAIPIPKDGHDADPEAVATIVIQRIANDLDVVKSSISSVSDRIEETSALVLSTEAVKELVSQAIEALPAPKDGQDGTSVTLEDIRPLVASAVADIPLPKNGEPGKDADPELIIRHVMENLDTDAIAVKAAALIPAPKDGEDGLPGKDADVEAVAAIVAEQAKDAIGAIADEIRLVRETVDALPPIPAPVDKAEIVAEVRALIPDPQPGEPGKPGEPGAPGLKGDPGADGLAVKEFIRGQNDNLIVTMSDGSIRDLGVFVGKDGDPGAPGKDGTDGFGWEDMDEVLADDGRTIIRRYVHGDKIKEFRHKFAVPLDRGVYKDDTDYEKGDMVSWAGSSWIAQQDGKGQKPDNGGGYWRLHVKRGRDGKDGVLKEPPSGKVKI